LYDRKQRGPFVDVANIQDARLWPLERLRLGLHRRAFLSLFERFIGCTSALQSFIHRNCGQLCGQQRRSGLPSVDLQGLEQIAHSLSTNKALKINHLDDYESDVTRAMARQATFGAVVDFSARANAGFADD
jgi:hypothetical protein